MRKCLLLLLAASVVEAQSLSGVVDFHVHCDPDDRPRSIDAIDIAKLARDRGMRALVLKNHYAPTESMAYLVRKVVPGIEVFGGIALNRPVGGINPAAVERMARVKGGWGRVVWMPTFDAENQVRKSKESRPFVSVWKDGVPLPEVREVMKVIAAHNLVLATGHSSPEEVLMLIREAKQAGVKSIVVTHAMLLPVGMKTSEMIEATRLGAYIEFVYNALIGPDKSFDISDYARAIRDIGHEHCILSSDLGQAGNPLHPDGLEAFFALLRGQGFSVKEIDQMAKVNPAKLLGLSLP